MDITTFLSIGVVGGLASLIIEVIKSKVSDSMSAKLITIAVAIVGGTALHFAQQFGVLESIMAVLATASTIYAFFLKK